MTEKSDRPKSKTKKWSAESEAWFAEHLAKAPPLSDERRRRIEALLSVPELRNDVYLPRTQQD